MCFNKNDFLLLLNDRFFLFFDLLDNQATHITWLSEEDPAELCQTRSVGQMEAVGEGRVRASLSTLRAPRSGLWFTPGLWLNIPNWEAEVPKWGLENNKACYGQEKKL